MLFFQGNAPVEKSETEDAGTGAESDEKDKVSDADVFSPAAAQSPGVETNLDFVKYTCDTRKTAMKEGNIITISSVTQARVRIDGFTSGRNMLGKMIFAICRFVFDDVFETLETVFYQIPNTRSEKRI